MQENNYWKVQDLLGKAVLNPQHELLGHIIDIEIAPDEGRINFAELLIDSESPARSVFVPWSQFSVDQAGGSITAPFGRSFLQTISRPRDNDSD